MAGSRALMHPLATSITGARSIIMMTARVLTTDLIHKLVRFADCKDISRENVTPGMANGVFFHHR
jgi:hypothetical protein